MARTCFIDRATGRYELTETRMGLVAVLNDLHKGRDSGKRLGGELIDVSAVLMTLVSLTGLLLIFFLQKKRLSGLLVGGGGRDSFAIWRTWRGCRSRHR